MKKKRLDSPSEILLPELKKKASYIKFDCPDCERNDSFVILETLVEAKNAIGGFIPKDEFLNDPNRKVRNPFNYNKTGRYRCKCTLCGFIQTFTSKNPRTGNYGN